MQQGRGEAGHKVSADSPRLGRIRVCITPSHWALQVLLYYFYTYYFKKIVPVLKEMRIYAQSKPRYSYYYPVRTYTTHISGLNLKLTRKEV